MGGREGGDGGRWGGRGWWAGGGWLGELLSCCGQDLSCKVRTHKVYENRRQTIASALINYQHRLTSQ